MTRFVRAALAAVALTGLTVGGAHAQAQAVDETIDVGERAPIFEGRTDEGTIWRSREHVGRGVVVVYFFPAAMTSGCTTQACLFRDNRTVLDEMGAQVIGVSGDRIDALKAFRGVNQLNFPLVSDTAGVVAKAFGVPTRDGGSIEREVDGQTVTLTRDLTMSRWTFVIDREGRISYKDTEVDPAGDSARVIAHIRNMTAGQ